jgi:hypothetical protein
MKTKSHYFRFLQLSIPALFAMALPQWGCGLLKWQGGLAGIADIQLIYAGQGTVATPYSISKSKMHYYSLSRRAGEGWGEGGIGINKFKISMLFNNPSP